MKFGKHILSEQVPGWSPHYLDYKFLKKIVSSLTAKRPGAEAAALALGMRPADILSPAPSESDDQTPLAGHPNIWESSLMITDPDVPPIAPAVHGEDTSLDFQAHKAAFFFKLERELEKINGFYLQKEAELKLRLETLLSKRRAAALRTLPDATDDLATDHVEWTAVEEGFRLLERDLAKLLQFIELNATGFRKILKKWDKRSKSQTKELYLAREVEVQPVFNRQLISDLADTVAACLLDLTDLSRGVKYENPAANDLILTRQLSFDQSWSMRPYHDLESSLRKAVQRADATTVEEVIRHSDVLTQQPGGRTNVTRILWKAVIDSPQEFADLILSIASNLFDFKFVDDINGRTCLHQAAMVGMLRLVNICLDNNVPADKVDAYGRSALHYAAMNGHAPVCRRLLGTNVRVDLVDMDNLTPLIHATLKGSLECVRVLVDEAASPTNPPFANVDLSPLSLASRTGHLDVVTFLIETGAENKPNSNGQYPIHLAAKEGRVDVCRFLIRRDGWDLPDKYHEWTPLFHAARYGHADCLRLLLEAGAQVHIVDEFGQLPIHYAAWYGHNDCTGLLLESSRDTLSTYQTPKSNFSPASLDEGPSEDVDMIPLLHLPPPIMPYRFYGHNYLDKNCLVQITIGDKVPCRSTTRSESVKLYPSFMAAGHQENYLNSSPLFKIVITAVPDAASGPFSIPLPLRDQPLLFAFQALSIDTLRLDFSLYPNFGTKTLGRAVALPTLLKKADRARYVLPILDHKLHLIGEVTFGLNVITPFSGVTLEVGGAVETYWKSTAIPPGDVPRPWSVSTMPQGSPRPTDTPPSDQPAAKKDHSLTISSITGDYVYVVVQVTRDMQPVVYPHWKLPGDKFDLHIPNMTLAQFEKFAVELGRNVDIRKQKPATPAQWYSLLRGSMLSLAELFLLVPLNVALCLEVACLPCATPDQPPSSINASVDCLLRTIYQKRPDAPGNNGIRRRIVFTSFSPDVCAALNWKQPNYPVFFGSLCGREASVNPSPTVLAHTEAGDERSSSLESAVRFSKANNLLGVFIEADILVKVPSLVRAVKDAGLLVLTWGTAEVLASLTSTCETYDGALDAHLHDGVLTFWEHPKTKIG